MTRICTWIALWRRSWESAWRSRFPGVRAHHRRMLLWMLRHPINASKTWERL